MLAPGGDGAVDLEGGVGEEVGVFDHDDGVGAAGEHAAGGDDGGLAGVMGVWGWMPGVRMSGVRWRRRGVEGEAPSVSEARRAKPSTLARSKPGTSTGARMSAARMRVRAWARGMVSGWRGARWRWAWKRRSASSVETTSRNWSWRAAAWIFTRVRSWEKGDGYQLDGGAFGIAFGGFRHQDEGVGGRRARGGCRFGGRGGWRCCGGGEIADGVEVMPRGEVILRERVAWTVGRGGRPDIGRGWWG